MSKPSYCGTDETLEVFRVAIESVTHAIFITDRDGVFEYVNPAFTRVTGYSSDEVIGCSTRILKSGLMEEAYYQRLWCAVLAGQSWSERITNRRKSGELYQARQIISPILDERSEPCRFVAIQEDVTERSRAEQRLRELSREYESIFVNTQDAIFLIEVREGPEFRFVRLNPTHERITGLRTESVRDKTPVELFGEDLGEALSANYRRCVELGELVVYDEMLNFGGGVRSWRTRLAPVFDGDRVVEIVGTSRDITIEERLKNEQQIFFEVSPDPFAILTSDGRFHQVSPTWSRTLGVEPSVLVGTHLLDRVHPDDRETGIQLLEQLGSGEEVYEFEMRLRGEDREYRWLSWSAARPTHEGLIYAVARDVQENKRLREQLIELSSIDVLTGIANRMKGGAELRRESERAKRYGVSLSLLVFDIDHFKQINDTHGHAVGDEVLRATCGAIRSRLRPTDTFARWGGEEFIVVLPDTDASSAAKLAERLRGSVAAGGYAGGLTVTISIGVAEYRNSEDPETGLLRRADDALYAAKANGRNQVRIAE